MIVDIMTRKQIKEFIIKEVKKSSEFYYKEIDQLRKRIMKLEEEIKAYRVERRLKNGRKK